MKRSKLSLPAALAACLFSLLLSRAASAGDEGKAKPHLCPACLQEGIEGVTKGGEQTIIAGKCPECKTQLLLPLMGEKMCVDCARARCACARCFVATGWADSVGRGVKPQKGRIFITSSPEGRNVISSLKPDGKDLKQITRGDFPLMDCAVSPDGLWLSFMANRDGNWEIYMCDVEGGNLRRLTKTPQNETNPSWFPGSETLVAVREGETLQLVVLRRDGGPETLIDTEVPGQNCGFPEVSADGRRIYFVGSPDARNINTFEIWAWEMGNPKKPAEGVALKLTENQVLDGRPMPSPDGKKVVYVSNVNGDDDLFVMTSDGKKQQCVYKAKGIDGNPCWSPDGKKIVFFSLPDYNDASGAEIFILDLKTGKTVQLTKNAHKDLMPRWR